MSALLYRGGASDPTTEVCVQVWPDATGTYTVSCGGQSQSEVVSSVADRAGHFAKVFTGLTPGSAYTVTLTDPSGAAQTMAARTVAASGAHKTVIGSCFDQLFRIDRAVPAMLEHAADQVALIGDTPYIDTSSQWTLDPTDDNLRYQHQRFRQRRPTLDLYQSGNLIQAASDHDYAPGNDFPGRDDTGAFDGDDAVNANGTVCSTQGEYDALKANNIAIWRSLNRWPPNPEIGATYGGGPVPAGCEYTRWTVGRVEYFILDMVGLADFRDSGGVVTSKTILGAVQKAWLLARLAASTAPFKCLLMPNALLWPQATSAGRRPDYGHKSFAQERAALLAALTDTSAWAVPGGVFVITGDVHTPTVYQYTDGETITQFCACPSGQDMLSSPFDEWDSGALGVSSSANVAWLWWEQYGAADPITRYYNLVEDNATGPLVVKMMRSDGTVCGKPYLFDAGSNTPRFERTRVGR